MIPNKIVIHHSASGFNTKSADIDYWHKLKFNFKSSLGYYIGYHYVIDVEGKVLQARRDNEVGAHSIPNEGAIGICLIGDFTKSEPRDAQLDMLLAIVEKLEKTYNIVEVVGHLDRNKTECPGPNLQKYVEKITKISWLKRLIKKLLGLLK